MASKGKSRNSGKSQSPTPSHGNGTVRKSSRGKDARNKDMDDKEKLAFKVLSAEHSKLLIEIDNVDDLEIKLAEILQIKDQGIDLKEGSTLDYFVAGLWWAKEQGFNHEQASAFFTIVHILLENIKAKSRLQMENTEEKQMTIVDTLKDFKKMFVGISADTDFEAPARVTVGGLETLFDVAQAKAITEYVNISFFQHYKLFEFMFCHTQAEEIIGTDLVVEVPLPASVPWPPPLDEGVSGDIHRQYIATPPPTPDLPVAAEEGESSNLGTDGVEADAEAAQREADILAQLSAEQITQIMDNVFTEMLGSLEADIAAKIRERENAYINRINKIYKVADK